MCLSLMDEPWDVAIILDACRYDVFKELYRQYLPPGKLEQRLGASDTLDYLHSVFHGHGTHDIVYVSAHPGINSKGVTWGHFNAREEFYKVYDAWISGWNWRIGSTEPDEVTRMAVEAIDEYPHRRAIIHFVQPHFPYRQAPCQSTYSDLMRPRATSPKLAIALERLLRRLIGSLGVNLSRLRTPYWQLKNAFNLHFLEDLNEFYWREYTIETLRRFYRDNLEWVLDPVGEIVEEFRDKEIVVTSDHGEAFGENGEFFHVYGTKNPVVRLVPFWQNKT